MMSAAMCSGGVGSAHEGSGREAGESISAHGLVVPPIKMDRNRVSKSKARYIYNLHTGGLDPSRFRKLERFVLLGWSQ